MRKPRDILVFYKDGKRYEFDNSPENCVVVKLHEEITDGFKKYKEGDIVVIPKKLAEILECEIISSWREADADGLGK